MTLGKARKGRVRTRRAVIWAGGLAAIAVLSSCGSQPGSDGVRSQDTRAAPTRTAPTGTEGAKSDAPTPERSRSRPPITGTHWNIERLRLDGGVTAAPHGSAWITFDGTGHAEGSLGCHRFRAAADIDDSRVRIGDVRMSAAVSSPGPEDGKADCGRERATFEKYVKLLLRGELRADRAPSADTVFLVNTRKDGFELQRGVPAPLLGTEWTVDSLFEYDSQVAPDDIAPGIGEVHVVFESDGTVHGTLGCNDFEAKAEIGPATMEFSGAATTTDRPCGESAASVEQRMLRDFRKEARYRLGHDSLSVYTGDDVPLLAGGFHARTDSRSREGERG
ncbi:META domain-containing protein [Streptomyces sp. NPDC018019]|uniref:META domain-containing protein n=1 Tax=Streptomyces sp. NPDC018019 TaxID=3365030 RepID=UPI00378A80F4